MGALGSDMASLMAIVAASRVVVDEGGLVLQLVEAGSRADGGMGRRADEASTVALMEFGAEAILYAVSFLLKGVLTFFQGNGFDPTRLELGIEGDTWAFVTGVLIVVGLWVEGGLSDEPIEALLDSEEAGGGHLVSSEGVEDVLLMSVEAS
jgi:hypothetical protein